MALTDKIIYPNRTDSPFDTFNNISNPFYGNDVASTGDSYLDPYPTGYAFIYWVSLPSWFEKDDDLKHFKTATQKSLRGVQGLADTTLQFATVNSGFAGNEANFVTGVQRGNTDFTLSFREYDGMPIRNLFRKWEGYIRDPNTGLCLYPSQFGVEYGCRNHSGQLLYILVRPDANNANNGSVIEDAVLYLNVVPQNDPRAVLMNYQVGTTDAVSEITVDMHGVPDMSPAVKEYAAKVLKDHILYADPSNPEGNLFLTNLMHAGDPGTELLTHGILKDVYNSKAK